MKLSRFFVFNAIVALAFGIGFVLMPGTLLSIYGMDTSPPINLMAQLFGVELISVGLLCWFIRGKTDSAVMPQIMLAFIIADLIGLIILLMGVFSGVLNAIGWSTVAIYFVLVVGYTYFWLRRDV